MSRIVVLYQPFNRWIAKKEHYERIGERPPALTSEWCLSRIKTWQRTSLKSTKNQSEKNFIHCVHINKDTIIDVRKTFKNNNIKCLFNKQDDVALLNSLSKYDEIVLLRLDSDDMYRNDVIEELYTVNFHECYYFKHGYSHDIKGNVFWKYSASTVGPFYAIMHHSDVFLKNPSFYEKGHKNIPKYYSAKKLPGRRFIINTHQNNTSSKISMFKTVTAIVDLSKFSCDSKI